MKTRRLLPDLIPTALAAVLIVYFAVTREQTLLKTLPTLVTLAVQLLLVAANRYAFLLGGVNALLYGVAYLSEGLWFSVVSAVCISAPIQIFSFFHWGKHRRGGQSAELKLLSGKQRLFTGALTLLSFFVCAFVLAPFFEGATYPSLDALIFTLGVAVSILASLRYVESQYVSAVSTLISVVMWVLIALEHPESFNYVIISLYNAFRIIQAAVRWTGQYLKQKRQEESAE